MDAEFSPGPESEFERINHKAENERPTLSNYTDYREYLRDFYQYKKVQDQGLRPYSYAVFSAAADIRSPNYLKLIIDGQRNLSENMIIRFARALQLSKDEAYEFAILVRFNQVGDPLQRNRYLKMLSEHRHKQKIAKGELDRGIWEKVPGWLAWVIFAMVEQDRVEFRIDELRKLIRAKVTREDIRNALLALFQTGELRKVASTGEVLKDKELVAAPKEIPNELVRKIQAELIYLGIESLFKDSPEDKEFGAWTMALTRSEFEEAKFALRKVRKDLHRKFSANRKKAKGDRVYQLNIQLFAVSDSARV